MISKSKEAVATFNQDYNCCQAILSAFAPSLGLDRNLCLKMGTGFPGGLGYRGEMCGALIAGFLVLGLMTGNTVPNDELRKELTYDLIREFIAAFTAKHGHTQCKELLGVNINTQEGFDQAAENGSFVTLCPRFVGDAAAILETIFSKYTDYEKRNIF